MKITVVADDLDDARRERATELERDLRSRQARERVGNEPRVERDRRRLTLDGGVDLPGVVTNFGGVRRDDERRLVRWIHLEPQHVRCVAREVRRETGGLEQLFSLCQYPRRVARRDDLPVIRELPLDDPRDEISLVGVKDYLAPIRSHEDIDRALVGVLEDSCDLEQTLCGNDHLDRRINAVE